MVIKWNEYYRGINLVFFLIILFYFLWTVDTSNGMYIPAICYIVFNIVGSILPREVFWSWPHNIIKITGFVRYLVMAFVLQNGYQYVSTDVKIIFCLEIVTVYSVFFIYGSIRKPKYEELHTNVEETVMSSRVGVSMIIVILVAGAIVFSNRAILAQYFTLSMNKPEVSYSSGLIGLLVSAFFIIVYALVTQHIAKLSILSNFIKIALIILVSVFYVNGASITSGSVSRWGLLIASFVVYCILIHLFPECRKRLSIILAAMIVGILVVGTVMKYTLWGQTNLNTGTIVEDLFSYKSLNAYFAGPRNMETALNLERGMNETSTLRLITSDVFHNFPLLNKYLSDPVNNSVALFNRAIYGSSLASDQIIPFAGQLFLYFKWLFFIPEAIFVWISLRVNDKLIAASNLFDIYCLAYAVCSLSLINCLSLTIFFQMLWINILPIILIQRFNLRFRTRS